MLTVQYKLFFTLLSAIFLDLPITRTFFYFPWRFELSGVDCSSVRVGTQGLFHPYLKTFVPPFLRTGLTAPGSPRMIRPRLGGLPHLKTFTWQNLTPAETGLPALGVTSPIDISDNRQESVPDSHSCFRKTPRLIMIGELEPSNLGDW